MSGVATAVFATTVGSAVLSKQAGDKAASAQRYASNQAIQAQRSEFDKSVEILKPYVSAGNQAVDMQKAILGLSGAEGQQEVISGIQGSPEYQTMIQQGEEAMLQNASATGGLRGGNIQEALSRFRPQLLSSLIDQRYNRLGGLASIGQASAAQQAAQGNALGAGIAQQYGIQGTATAQNKLATGNAWSQGLSGVTQAVTGGSGGGGFGGLF